MPLFISKAWVILKQLKSINYCNERENSLKLLLYLDIKRQYLFARNDTLTTFTFSFFALFKFGNDLGNSKLWILNVWESSWIVLTFWCMSQNGQIHFKNLKAKTVRFKVCLTILRYYPLKNQIHKNVNFVKNYNMKYLKKNTFDQRKYSGHSSALHLTYFSPLTSFYTPLKTSGNLWLD